jgi:phosphoglucomutase/phosphopentomutase
MITASHNPKQDNGFKVYWESGSQIISPHDKNISNMIEKNREPWSWNLNTLTESPLCIDPYEVVYNSYFDLVEELSIYR